MKINKRNRVRIFSLTALAMVLLSTVTSGQQTMYRFSLFESAKYSGQFNSALDALQSNMPAERRVERGSTYGFEDFVFAEFSSDQSVVFAPRSGVNLPSGDFSIVAHIRPVELTGEQWILQTPESSHGYLAMGLDGGRLFGEVLVANGDQSVFQRIHAPEALESGVWYRLVYTVSDQGTDGIVHSLWIDEDLVVREQTPEIRLQPDPDGSEVPTVGGSLDADVFAVELFDYELADYFLESPLIRDGSAYFGMPAYFGELAGGRHVVPLDQRLMTTIRNPNGSMRYPEMEARLENRWIFPFHNDSFVIQGIAADPENGRIFLGMYHRSADNVSYGFPSIVVELFVPEGRMGNVFVLQTPDGAPFTSHMGGIAYWDELVFVPGPSRGSAMDPDLYVFDVSSVDASDFDPGTMEGFELKLLPALHRYTDPLGVLGSEGRFNSLSYMDIHVDKEDRILLNIGNFQADVARPVHSFHLLFTDRRHPYLMQPRTVMQTNRRAQGGVYYLDVETPSGVQARRMLLSTSFGDSDSVIFNSLYLEPDPQPRTSQEWMRLPAGLEDMTQMGNSLWTTSESGMVYFQKRPSNPWTDLFPFLIQIDMGDLIDTRGHGVTDAWYTKHGLTGSVDPATDRDGDGFSIRDEYLWDTDPEDPAVYPWSGAEVHASHLSVETSLRRFYTLQRLDLDSGSWENVPDQVNRRGNGGLMDFPLPELESEDANFYRVVVGTGPQ